MTEIQPNTTGIDRQTYLDPCLTCDRTCGVSYRQIPRVRGHFCSSGMTPSQSSGGPSGRYFM